jgi:DNA-binding NtrC family response regulator
MLNHPRAAATGSPATIMRNGSQSLSPLHFSQSADKPADHEGEFVPPTFVCVSSALRRLLLQGEIAVPRLQFATLDGEPGSGKHLFAQTLHRLSAHAHLPFLRRDAREWLATETDAASLAGTLYLDRADLLAHAGQNLLLSLVKMVQDAAPPRFLLLISSHVSLRGLASQGLFLPDLAFRLTAVRFPLPPLRDHREDIAPITQALIDRICRRYQQPVAALASGTLPRLLQHAWPGSVRELASILESAILDSTTGVIRPANLDLALAQHPVRTALPAAYTSEPSAAPALPEDLTLDAVIHRHIQFVLDLNRGNKLRAARQLGISRSTLYRLLAGEATLES